MSQEVASSLAAAATRSSQSLNHRQYNDGTTSAVAGKNKNTTKDTEHHNESAPIHVEEPGTKEIVSLVM